MWLRQVDFNETHEEKALWVLGKHVACCLEQILEAARLKKNKTDA